ncbi:MAG: hypothetical protein JW904_11210 [Spirochaetales bacterium]|nr:hypothetical protein [Spirochaetales bacterium]
MQIITKLFSGNDFFLTAYLLLKQLFTIKGEEHAMKAVNIIFTFLNTISILGILFLFTVMHFFPEHGPVLMILSTVLLLFIGFLFIILFFLEKRNLEKKLAFRFLRQYFTVTLRFIMIISSAIELVILLVSGIIRSNGYLFISAGCIVAFIMVILLIELVIRILLPLSGVHNPT